MFLWRTTFFENVFLDVDNNNDVFGNRLEFVLPRMTYLLDNNNFQTALYFNWFLHVDVLNMVEMIFVENVYFSGLAFCNATGRCICNMCKCMTLRCWFYFSWNLRCEALEVNCMLHVLDGSSMLHDRIKENKDNTAQWPTEPGQVSFACFVCCVKRVRVRSSFRICWFNLRVFASLFIGIAAAARTPTRRFGVRERSG